MKYIKPNSIHNMNCMVGMQKIQNNSVDLIQTDPPFGISFKSKKNNYNRKGKNVLNGYSDVHESNYFVFSVLWMQQAYRILKEEGSLFVFSGWNNLRHVLNALDVTGFKLVNHIIWKYQFGPATKKRFVTSHWHLLYACKDNNKRKFYLPSKIDGSERYCDMEDVWKIKREYWHGMPKTPTKLPRQIVEKILSYSTRKKDVVMDPFAGSGQIPLLAKFNGRKYIGFEIVKDYYDFAKRRINKNMYFPQ